MPKGAAGPRALLVAVVTRAVRDLSSPDAAIRRDARDYLASDLYRRHLEALGFDPAIVNIQAEHMTRRDEHSINRWRHRPMTEAEAGAVYDRQVKRTAAEQGIGYNAAVSWLAENRPHLFENYTAQVRRARAAARQRPDKRPYLDVLVQELSSAWGIGYSATVDRLQAEHPGVLRELGMV